MIRAIITDVDGVLVGKTPGVNFPIPSDKVLQRLKSIRESGIPIILCSGKTLFPMLPIIEKAQLDNLHIADGGSVIVDPLTNTKEIFPLKKEIIEKILYFTLENSIYTEVHAFGKYFIQKDQEGEFTSGHAEIMQQQPIVVGSLLEIIGKEEIIKIMVILPTETEKPIIEPLLQGLAKDIGIYWGVHPSMLPAHFGLITAHGVSKKHAAEKIMKSLDISFDEVLGIGDTAGDWSFMELCGYNTVIGDDKKLQ